MFILDKSITPLGIKMEDRTSIDIRIETRKRLKKFKMCKSESYEDELNRIMDKMEKAKDYNQKIFKEVK